MVQVLFLLARLWGYKRSIPGAAGVSHAAACGSASRPRDDGVVSQSATDVGFVLKRRERAINRTSIWWNASLESWITAREFPLQIIQRKSRGLVLWFGKWENKVSEFKKSDLWFQYKIAGKLWIFCFHMLPLLS